MGVARGIVAAQTKEIRQMNTWRTDWDGEPSPAGGVPAASRRSEVDDRAEGSAAIHQPGPEG
jgi:uncharacterized protein (DUF305 family)